MTRRVSQIVWSFLKANVKTEYNQEFSFQLTKYFVKSTMNAVSYPQNISKYAWAIDVKCWQSIFTEKDSSITKT